MAGEHLVFRSRSAPARVRFTVPPIRATFFFVFCLLSACLSEAKHRSCRFVLHTAPQPSFLPCRLLGLVGDVDLEQTATTLHHQFGLASYAWLSRCICKHRVEVTLLVQCHSTDSSIKLRIHSERRVTAVVSKYIRNLEILLRLSRRTVVSVVKPYSASLDEAISWCCCVMTGQGCTTPGIQTQSKSSPSSLWTIKTGPGSEETMGRC